MGLPISLAVAGAAGNDVGADSDGVLLGRITATALDDLLTSSHALAARCMTESSNLYTDETVDFGDAGSDDVPLLPDPPVVGDATYFGHATAKFPRLDIDLSTAGDWVGTGEWQYWDGAQWSALDDVVDGSSNFEAAAGVVSVSYTEPEDWAKNTVDNVLAYWIRYSVTAVTSMATQPLAKTGNVVSSAAGAVYTDDTTDANDADAGDVALLPTLPAVNDAVYVGYSGKFCKVKVTISQARTGVATFVLEYWNGSAWTEVPIYDDDTAGWSAAAGTYFIHFVPPSDWAANTAPNGPNGQTGYFVRMRMSAMTSVTQQPLATRFWVLPIAGSGTGLPMVTGGTCTKITGQAKTPSATNNDSVFLLINKTAGTFVTFTWTKNVPIVVGTVSLAIATNAEIALVQIKEDGTTEFQNSTIFIHM